MERETVNFETKHGHKLVFKAYVTGKEGKEVQGVLAQGVEMTYDEITGKPKLGSFDPQFAALATDKLIEIMVVSVDGNVDDLVGRVENLRKEDYDGIVAKLNDMTELLGKKKEDVEEK